MATDSKPTLSKAIVTGNDNDQRDSVTYPDVPGTEPAGAEEHSERAMHCHICTKMRKSRPQKHSSLVSGSKVRTCLLCCRDFCNKHNGPEEDVCEINHRTYFKNHGDLEDVYPSMAVRESVLGISDRGD